jgi:hypothetical protein
VVVARPNVLRLSCKARLVISALSYRWAALWQLQTPVRPSIHLLCHCGDEFIQCRYLPDDAQI